MNRDDTATALSKYNRITNAILEATTSKTRTMTQTTSTKNTPCLRHTANRQVNEEYEMTVRLPSLWLWLAIELASQIEQQPLLPDLCPPKTLVIVKFAVKEAKVVKN